MKVADSRLSSLGLLVQGLFEEQRGLLGACWQSVVLDYVVKAVSTGVDSTVLPDSRLGVSRCAI